MGRIKEHTLSGVFAQSNGFLTDCFSNRHGAHVDKHAIEPAVNWIDGVERQWLPEVVSTSVHGLAQEQRIMAQHAYLGCPGLLPLRRN